MSGRSPQRAAPAARRAPPAPLTARGSPTPFLAPPRAAFCAPPSVPYLKQMKMGDVNSFMMLFFDNFSSLLGILAAMISMPDIKKMFPGNPYREAYETMVFQKVVPGFGVALVFGNLWYAWMASKLSKKEGRMDVTALPYGINTPAGFLTVFLVMLPIVGKYNPDQTYPGYYKGTPDEFAEKVMYAGCCACFIGGLFEISGILIGEFLRKNIARAALFGPIMAVGFVWLGYAPLTDVMREPIIGFIPLILTFTGFFSNNLKGCYPAGFPTALVIFGIGTFLWWMGAARWDTEDRELNERDLMADIAHDKSQNIGKIQPRPFVMLAGFEDLDARLIAIQFPIALASFIETIENVEAAAIEGDSYNVNEAMLVDGLGTAIGALFGSVCPTTVYIGHKRHKEIGATCWYSIANGVAFFILTWSGLLEYLFYVIDGVSIGCILIAVGLMIVQQAIERSASRHVPALMIAIMFGVADVNFFDGFDKFADNTSRKVGRMLGAGNMAPGGGIMCSIILTAILCDVIDLRFVRASIYSLIAMLFSLFGLMHGNNHVFPDGQKMFPYNDHTTDLGEVMLSTATFPTKVKQGDDVVDIAGVDTDKFHYLVNWKWVGFGPGDGLPEGTPRIVPDRACNEGWRFAVGAGRRSNTRTTPSARAHPLTCACAFAHAPMCMPTGRLRHGLRLLRRPRPLPEDEAG